MMSVLLNFNHAKGFADQRRTISQYMFVLFSVSLDKGNDVSNPYLYTPYLKKNTFGDNSSTKQNYISTCAFVIILLLMFDNLFICCIGFRNKI